MGEPWISSGKPLLFPDSSFLDFSFDKIYSDRIKSFEISPNKKVFWLEEFILALDQGTSSSRALLYDNSGKTISIAQQAIEMSHPKDGWVE